MDLSIIIPCYNLEFYIAKCLRSIIAQKLNDITTELIFICDSCTDKTAEIITNMMEETTLNWTLKIVSHRSSGLSRNIGLDLARGDYIWFIDGDDWLLGDGTIQTLMTILFQDNKLDYLKFDFQSQKFTWKGDVMVWRYIFKKSFIGDLRFSNKMPAEDDDFINTIKKKPSKNKEIKTCYYWYNHPREGSIMDTVIKNKWKPVDWSKV